MEDSSIQQQSKGKCFSCSDFPFTVMQSVYCLPMGVNLLLSECTSPSSVLFIAVWMGGVKNLLTQQVLRCWVLAASRVNSSCCFPSPPHPRLLLMQSVIFPCFLIFNSDQYLNSLEWLFRENGKILISLKRKEKRAKCFEGIQLLITVCCRKLRIRKIWI